MPRTAPLDSRLQSRIDAFVAEITEVVREEAMAAVFAALGSGDVPIPYGRGAKRVTKTAGKKKATKARAKKAKSGRRVRRTAEDLEELGASFLAHVKAKPGLRLEEIGAALGTATVELKRPVTLLMAARKLRTTGQKRGTKYFAGNGGAVRKKAVKKKTAKRRTVKKKVGGKRSKRKATKGAGGRD